MFTLVGFDENVGATTTGEKLTALADDHVAVSGDTISVPELTKLLGAYAIGTDIDNPYLAAPSLRSMMLYHIMPFEVQSLPAYEPDAVISPEGKITLVEDEQLTAYADNNNAGAQHESVLVFLGDDSVSPVSGQIYTIKATATAPATSYAWGAAAAMTLTDELPKGEYQLVGAACQQANTIAFRFVFIGGRWRPGHISCINHSKHVPINSRWGRMGVWGTFRHDQIPSVEFFGDGTGGAAELYLDVIKVS